MAHFTYKPLHHVLEDMTGGRFPHDFGVENVSKIISQVSIGSFQTW